MISEENKLEVAKWFAAGASLDEIQKRLKSEFDIHMTYLDLRLLVADLPQPVEEDPVAQDAPQSTSNYGATAKQYDQAAHSCGAEQYDQDDRSYGATASSHLNASDQSANPSPRRYNLDAPDADEGKSSPDVLVELDVLTIPGTYASGDVTFSDGTKAKWYLDQQGRLGIGNAPEGYRPSPEDAAIFQARLMDLLRSRGMA